MAQDKPVTLAAVTGAHGVTGEVRLKLLGEGLDGVKVHKSFNEGALTLTGIRGDNKGGAIARFAEITNRNTAEALRGTTLSVPRSALPELGEGEYYHADLVGLRVVTETGEGIGIVHAIENYGATDIVEIQRANGKRFMVPMVDAAIPEWDTEKLVVMSDFCAE